MALSGKPVADTIRAAVSARTARWRAEGVRPRMVILLIDGDPASACYAEAKVRTARRIGIEAQVWHFPRDVREAELIESIARLNADDKVHGVMLELPLPPHLDEQRIVEAIDPCKDVDGLTSANRMANLTGAPGIYPATPLACVALLRAYGYSLYGKRVTLVGCGKTVGQPLLHVLLRERATVTVCHEATVDIAFHLRTAEIAFVAVGKAGLITKEMVHKDLVLIDAGINQTPDGRIVGDVDPAVADVVAALSPTPGGVGTVTTMQLFANLMHALDLQVARHERPSAQHTSAPPAQDRLVFGPEAR
ncbi:bifunctional 5,10-methylenetetrahydrofolate dehydrogenase/5,10-methenyltetrahydrofolate cyclohydrolase [Alicyclobacillus cellulosilyticus]|nr:bifunctional 5,10-methylenetetrahydrofolate dehydrogenase/5,10-methenyltetrahydrofolate cyclohydrolase [Alicyclobacillus cellulosilyticus]